MAMLILTGDVNLKGVTDAAVPLARVADDCARPTSSSAISNACSARRRPDHSHSNEGFFADPAVGARGAHERGHRRRSASPTTCITARPINASIAQLDRIGILHTGAGQDLAAARAPAIVERGGVRFGFLQRSSVYWPTNHEARKEPSASP